MFRGLERPISQNRRVPQSPQQLPNVELVLSAVHHGGEAEPYRRSRGWTSVSSKQQQVPMNQNPIILTSEMRARAKVPENHLQKLWKKVPPTKRPVDCRDRRRELRLGRGR